MMGQLREREEVLLIPLCGPPAAGNPTGVVDSTNAVPRPEAERPHAVPASDRGYVLPSPAPERNGTGCRQQAEHEGDAARRRLSPEIIGGPQKRVAYETARQQRVADAGQQLVADVGAIPGKPGEPSEKARPMPPDRE